MSKHEFTGKTAEEAISEGLRKLGCTISDVKVEVLEEGAKGLFGLFGSKQARVLLTMDDTKDDMLSALSSLTLDSFGDREKPKRERFERSERSERPFKAEQPSRADKPAASAAPARQQPVKPPAEKQSPERQPFEKQSPEKHPADKRPPERRPVEKPPYPPKTATPTRPEKSAAPAPALGFRPIPLAKDKEPEIHDPNTAMGRAQRFLQGLTRLMNVTVQVDVQADPEGNLFVQMIGDTLGILIGRRGETLDALQYLTSLQVNKGSEEYIRVTLDTENYRAKREDSLRRLATRMAARACKTGRKVAMEPMNPYERRILHASLQNHPHVTTHSEGEEPNRHVVITLKHDTHSTRRPAR